MKKTPEQVAQETSTANLMASFVARQSRRSLLKGVVTGAAGVTGIAVAGVGTSVLSTMNAHAAAAPSLSCVDSVHTILTVARTAERLATTFFSNAVANAGKLGLKGVNLEDIQAAAVEEQIHEHFLAGQGGDVLTSTFSFPHGPATFEDLRLFIETFEQLELVVDTTYLAAVKEFAQLGLPDMAQVAAQIAWVEGEHRAIARQIGAELLGSRQYIPPINWAFAPVYPPSVGTAPALVKKAGFLSPVPGNTYPYHPISISNSGVIFQKPVTDLAGVPCSE